MRTSVWGFMSGVLALLSLVLSIYIGIVLVTAVFLILGQLSSQAASAPLESQSSLVDLGPQLSGSVWQLANGLWRDRVGFLFAGLLGIIATWGRRAGQMVNPKWQWQVSFTGTAIAIVVPIITWLNVQRAEIGILAAERPEAAGWSDLVAASTAMIIGLALIFGLPLSYVFWGVWRWWHLRIGLRFGSFLDPDTSHHSNTRLRPPVVMSNRAGLTLVGFLTACAILYGLLNQYHSQVAIRVQHGTVRLDAISTPQHAIDFLFGEDVRSLRIVKRAGNGTVDVSLTSAGSPGNEQLIEGWAFALNDPNQYRQIEVSEMGPGPYQLQFQQQDGVGYFEYSLSHGGGEASHAAAIGMGLLLACGMLAGIGLIWWIVVRFSLIIISL